MARRKKKNYVEVPEAGGVLAIEARDRETGEVKDMSALEEGGIAYDPTTMHLDLTKAEKRRTTALMMAIQAYSNLIIKDAEYLREAHAQQRSGGPVIQPATMDAMVIAALQFDAFISGRMESPRSGIGRASQRDVPEPDGSAQAVDAVGPNGGEQES